MLIEDLVWEAGGFDCCLSPRKLCFRSDKNTEFMWH